MKLNLFKLRKNKKFRYSPRYSKSEKKSNIYEFDSAYSKIRENKSTLTSEICNYMDTNSIQNKRIEISDGYLRYAEKKEYSPLTYNYIEECLNKIIDDKEHVEFIISYLKNNRQIKTSYEIRRNDAK